MVRYHYIIDNNNLNWIINDNAIQEIADSISISRPLLRSYYFVSITETTIGYGGIVPFNIFEILYDVFLVIIGSFFAMHASYQQYTN